MCACELTAQSCLRKAISEAQAWHGRWEREEKAVGLLPQHCGYGNPCSAPEVAQLEDWSEGTAQERWQGGASVLHLKADWEQIPSHQCLPLPEVQRDVVKLQASGQVYALKAAAHRRAHKGAAESSMSALGPQLCLLPIRGHQQCGSL